MYQQVKSLQERKKAKRFNRNESGIVIAKVLSIDGGSQALIKQQKLTHSKMKSVYQRGYRLSATCSGRIFLNQIVERQ
jgi:hypothetical protein